MIKSYGRLTKLKNGNLKIQKRNFAEQKKKDKIDCIFATRSFYEQ